MYGSLKVSVRLAWHPTCTDNVCTFNSACRLTVRLIVSPEVDAKQYSHCTSGENEAQESIYGNKDSK